MYLYFQNKVKLVLSGCWCWPALSFVTDSDFYVWDLKAQPGRGSGLGTLNNLLFFADDVVLLSSIDHDWFAAECEVVEIKISTLKFETIIFCPKTVDCSLWVVSELLPKVNGFKSLSLDFKK